MVNLLYDDQDKDCIEALQSPIRIEVSVVRKPVTDEQNRKLNDMKYCIAEEPRYFSDQPLSQHQNNRNALFQGHQHPKDKLNGVDGVHRLFAKRISVSAPA